MKQIKFSLIDFKDPKKRAAVAIFILAFLAFIGEIITAFHSVEQIKRDNKPLSLASVEEPIRPHSPLFTAALFGDYLPANLEEGDIRKSMLDVQVVGIMFATKKEKESQVILRVGGGKEECYVVGDSLAGGAIIKRISPEGIVLFYNGALESLSLPKNKLLFDIPAKPLIKE